MAQNQQFQWLRDPRSLLRHILMLDDTPHSIALGTAIGMFIGMTPTVGIQMILVGIIAFLTCRLFHFNRIAALLTVYISNPFTLVPIYWFDYKVGTLFFEETVTREAFSKILQYDGFEGWLTAVTDLCVKVGTPLIFGSLVAATILGLATYPVMIWFLKKIHRERRPKQSQEPKPTPIAAE